MGFANQTDAIATAVPYIGLRGYPRIGISNNISNNAGLVTTSLRPLPGQNPWRTQSNSHISLYNYKGRSRGTCITQGCTADEALGNR
jgi:hypothetical protein